MGKGLVSFCAKRHNEVESLNNRDSTFLKKLNVRGNVFIQIPYEIYKFI
ncbi:MULTISPECIES: hypothetical protein [Clostridium]|nr:hypothetical protein [Clostridium sporogenes]EDU38885.1 hypothetical protein CLOSPO_01747 [Clostridium sporogenes ATCC 15579]MDU5117399.1 hypothetical protein [Clostridium botulinum]